MCSSDLGVVGTLEWMMGRDVNGIYYIDANLSNPDGTFASVGNPSHRRRHTTHHAGPTQRGQYPGFA